MSENQNSFDNLVSGISLDERITMLQHMKQRMQPEIDILQEPDRNDNAEIKTISNLKKESFFLRVYLTLKAIFSKESIEKVYIKHQLSTISKNISNNFPSYYDAQNMHLKQGFYDALVKLKKIAHFFKDGISESEEKMGDFLVFLGSLVMTDFEKKIEESANPYSIPFSQDFTPNLRLTLLRQMDSILASVSQFDKNKLYTCVKSLSWLTSFVGLPFDAFIVQFKPNASGKLYCSSQTSKKEIERFASILCNMRTVETEILEALYVFQMQALINSGHKVDIDSEIAAHMEESVTQVKSLKAIISSMPLKSINMVTHRSPTKIPEYKDSCEEWFVLYKEQWKKLFDIKWNRWLYDRKMFLVKERIMKLCGTDDYPLLSFRPWRCLDIKFSKDYSIGFLDIFMRELYSQFSDSLKIVSMEGDFILPENKIEFIDAFSDMNKLSQTVLNFSVKIADEGQYGTSFVTLKPESIYTIQGKMQIQNLLLTMESEVSLLALNFSKICKTFNALFSGILVASYDSSYDSISNLNTLLGPDKKPIRKNLVKIHGCLNEAESLLQEIESIELQDSNIKSS